MNQLGDPTLDDAPASTVFTSMGTEGLRLTGSVAFQFVRGAPDLSVDVSVADTDQNGRADLFSFDSGLTPGVTAGLKLTWYPGEITADRNADYTRQIQAWCGQIANDSPCGPRGGEGALEVALAHCESESCEEVRSAYNQRRVWHPQHLRVVSLRVAATYQAVTWLDLANANQSRDVDIGFKLQAGYTALVRNHTMSLGVGGTYERALEAPDEAVVCDDATSTPFSCRQGVYLSEIAEFHRVTLRGELRQYLSPRLGLSLRAQWRLSEANDDDDTNFVEDGFRPRWAQLDLGVFLMIDKLRVLIRPGVRVWNYDRAPEAQVDYVGTISLGGSFGLIQ